MNISERINKELRQPGAFLRIYGLLFMGFGLAMLIDGIAKSDPHTLELGTFTTISSFAIFETPNMAHGLHGLLRRIGIRKD